MPGRIFVESKPVTSQGVKGPGTPGFPNLFSHLIERVVSPMISRARTTSQESERSREARKAWNSSQGQQAAMLAQIVQQGTRNL